MNITKVAVSWGNQLSSEIYRLGNLTNVFDRDFTQSSAVGGDNITGLHRCLKPVPVQRKMAMEISLCCTGLCHSREITSSFYCIMGLMSLLAWPLTTLKKSI